jgi:hypothetical protein
VGSNSRLPLVQMETRKCEYIVQDLKQTLAVRSTESDLHIDTDRICNGKSALR